MTVPVSNMTATFANTSIRYDAIGMDVNANGSAVGSTLIHLKSNGLSKLTVDINGNMGINTLFPQANLHIAGVAANNALPELKITGRGALDFHNALGEGNWNALVRAGDKGIIFHDGTIETGSFVIAPWSNNSNGIKIQYTGNVGIGTDNPLHRLDVAGSINTQSIITNQINILSSNIGNANISSVDVINANITTANITTANIASANIGRISLVNQPIWQGYFFANTIAATNYTPNSVTQFSTGIQTVYTATNTAIVIPANGIYQVHAQQLISSGTNGLYLHIRKNVNTVAYAYMPGLTPTRDMIVDSLVQCNAGDIIDFYLQGNTTTTWGSPHSSVYIRMIA